jgi:hypothetical protein
MLPRVHLTPHIHQVFVTCPAFADLRAEYVQSLVERMTALLMNTHGHRHPSRSRADHSSGQCCLAMPTLGLLTGSSLVPYVAFRASVHHKEYEGDR